MKGTIIFFFLVLTVAFASCRKDAVIGPYEEPADTTVVIVTTYGPELPATLNDYAGHEYPQHFLDDPLLNLIGGFGGNTVTNEGSTLGRVLFYDKNLSANNTISCGSCHHQDKGFTDGLAFSPGFEGQLTGRNSMSIVNGDFQGRMFWDRRANSVETQVLMPIQDPIEMGMDLADLVMKLDTLPYYADLFEAAFGSAEITSQKIAGALGQFVRSIRSYRTKYDVGVPLNFSNFTTEEELGRQLFTNGDFRCNSCHATQNIGGPFEQHNGIDSIPVDEGVGGFTNDPDEIGMFKTVSLRNIELTAPYMHDGRFASLDEVMDFYSTDIEQHANLDGRLAVGYVTGGTPLQFNFTQAEKSAMIAFLNTLTDWEMVNDTIYSDPFPE
jgi:cytochrome c peroxidase